MTHKLTKAMAYLAIVLLMPTAQQTIYGPDGKVTGRVATDSQGSTTIYDAQT